MGGFQLGNIMKLLDIPTQKMHPFSHPLLCITQHIVADIHTHHIAMVCSVGLEFAVQEVNTQPLTYYRFKV